MDNEARNRQSDVSEAVAALLPLYSVVDQDIPGSVPYNTPKPAAIVSALRSLVELMLPGRMTDSLVSEAALQNFLRESLERSWNSLRQEIEKALPYRWKGAAAQTPNPPPGFDVREQSLAIVRSFFSRLAVVRQFVVEDIEAAYRGDPAALTYVEVKFTYPGLLAVVSHRIAHELYRLDVPIIPRIISEWTHGETGVDIHPGAELGHGVFIDHGTGVVIGETAKIGKQVKIYQGVTLGARSFPVDAQGNIVKKIQRHPTIEDCVVIYAHATILGGDTVIGAGSTIGGNVFITESVPAGSFVTKSDQGLQIKQKS